MKASAKVVIAEDDPGLSKIIAHAVSALGYAPVVCRDGLRALHVLEDNQDASLLISDVQMPAMDGKALVAELRGRPEFANLPVMLISGVARMSEIAHFLKSGVTCLLGKPFELSDLKAHIAIMVEHGEVWKPNQ